MCQIQKSTLSIRLVIENECLYLVSGLGKFGPWVNCPCAPTPHRSCYQVCWLYKFAFHTPRPNSLAHMEKQLRQHQNSVSSAQSVRSQHRKFWPYINLTSRAHFSWRRAKSLCTLICPVDTDCPTARWIPWTDFWLVKTSRIQKPRHWRRDIQERSQKGGRHHLQNQSYNSC